MRIGAPIAHFYLLLRPSPPSSFLRRNVSCSAAFPVGRSHLNKGCDEFLPWMRRKAGQEISSVLSIGISDHGRSLFASKPIRAGDCILKVPNRVQITPANMLSELESLFVHDVADISKLAVVILTEQRLGQESKWAPYIQSLPRNDEMHNTIFWSDGELEMVRPSRLYQETIDKKNYIEKQLSVIKLALGHASPLLEGCELKDFMHAYALDFLNHDGVSEAVLLSDEDKEISEVIADQDYAIGEEVLIRYGKFSNVTLLLDFGFTVPYNIHDQVQVQMDIPVCDPLYPMKLELLGAHKLPNIKDSFSSSGNVFTIKEVKAHSKKGKGIPQALRALARVLSATSTEELKAMEIEAAENDGRLARRPLKDHDREILAHRILLSRLQKIIQEHDGAIKVLISPNAYNHISQFALRRQMAIDVLKGEVRILRSACSWLEDYCFKLSVRQE